MAPPLSLPGSVPAWALFALTSLPGPEVWLLTLSRGWGALDHPPSWMTSLYLLLFLLLTLIHFP